MSRRAAWLLLLHTRTATWICDEWQAGRAQWAWQDGCSVAVAIWCDALRS